MRLAPEFFADDVHKLIQSFLLPLTPCQKQLCNVLRRALTHTNPREHSFYVTYGIYSFGLFYHSYSRKNEDIVLAFAFNSRLWPMQA
jgi:hypothetical protein